MGRIGNPSMSRRYLHASRKTTMAGMAIQSSAAYAAAPAIAESTRTSRNDHVLEPVDAVANSVMVSVTLQSPFYEEAALRAASAAGGACGRSGRNNSTARSRSPAGTVG